MHSRTNQLRILTVTAVLLCLGLAGIPAAADEPEFTSEFRLQDCHFRSWGANPFFILKPGFQLRLEGAGRSPGSSTCRCRRSRNI